jgi:uncharacterized membrane protein
MAMLKMFGTLIAFSGAVGLFASSASAVDFDAGIFHGGLARQVLEQQDAERHRAERPRYGIYEQGVYSRHSESERLLREAQKEAAAGRRARAANQEFAHKTTPVAPVATVAKLGDKLASDPARTTEVAKASTDTTTTAETADTTTADSEATAGSSSSDGKRVCRRFSAAIAAMVDVTCE